MDPESQKSAIRFYSVDYPEILVGWKVVVNDRKGIVLNCRRRFGRSAIYDIAFQDTAFTEEVVLNRKNKTNKKKYSDFELVSKEF
jgi:hypothetical protein